MISDEIIKVLDDLCERFGIVVDWTSENVVPQLTILCEKLITFLTVTKGLSVAVGISIIVCCILFAKHLYKTYLKCKNDCQCNLWWEYYGKIGITGIGFASAITVFFTFIVTTIMTMDNFTTLLKLLIIPELYLLEYFSNYMG